MHCLCSRYRAGHGEIDLIMEDGPVISAVEVKYRPTCPAGSGLAAITVDKQRRMGNAMLHFLIHHNLMDRQVRFDVL